MKKSSKFWLGGAAAAGVALASACVGDAASGPEATDAGSDSGAVIDAGSTPDSSTVTDAADGGTADAARCDPTKPFAAPELVPNIPALDGGIDNNVTLSPDELTMYLTSNRGGAGGARLFIATRARREDEFGAPALLGSTTTLSTGIDHPSITADSLSLYFATSTDLLVATRTTTASSFGSPAVLNIDVVDMDGQPFILPNGATLFFTSRRMPTAGLRDLWQASSLADGGFDNVQPLTELSTAEEDVAPAVSADALTIFFASTRPLPDGGAAGGYDVWTASRTNAATVFGTPTIVPEVSSPSTDWPMWISPDKCVLYLISGRPDDLGASAYRATRGK